MVRVVHRHVPCDPPGAMRDVVNHRNAMMMDSGAAKRCAAGWKRASLRDLDAARICSLRSGGRGCSGRTAGSEVVGCAVLGKLVSDHIGVGTALSVVPVLESVSIRLLLALFASVFELVPGRLSFALPFVSLVVPANPPAFVPVLPRRKAAGRAVPDDGFAPKFFFRNCEHNSSMRARLWPGWNLAPSAA